MYPVTAVYCVLSDPGLCNNHSSVSLHFFQLAPPVRRLVHLLVLSHYSSQTVSQCLLDQQSTPLDTDSITAISGTLAALSLPVSHDPGDCARVF